ncbi:MAG: hypothetical protein M3P51_19175 [Chloroflexota bacterium]|nr:hypothetical protein [Chloroflexota bacterium]
MSSNSHRLNVCEEMELHAEEDIFQLTQIIELSPDPRVDELAERIRQRARQRHLVAGPAGRVIRQLRIVIRSDDLWRPPDNPGGAAAMPVPVKAKAA